MPSTAPLVSIGIDFGTSNTVIAVATADGRVEAIRFDHGGKKHSVYVSALCFWEEQPGSSAQTEGGPWAIEQFLEGHHAHRFIQSFKTFAASASFNSTIIFRQRYRFEDLLAAFLRTLARHGGEAFSFTAPAINVGRPVRFAGNNPDEALAIQRYQAAFERLGATHVRYVYEPVGAAFSFARHLDHDATVLVADFGGGTSDFSLMRFSRAGDRQRAEALGHGGIGIAGDTFDYRIVDHIIAPRLGKGSSYRSFDKVLEIPNHYYASLARWHHLAMMKSNGDLRELRKLAHLALQPALLRDFITLVDLDLGFLLYRAVSDTKIALSAGDEVDFHFASNGLDIRSTITRRDFETWIADDIARLGATIDKVLNEAEIAAGAVEKVFLTGGTSFVPAVRRLFTERFGSERLISADQFTSIAYGLALIGTSPEAEPAGTTPQG
ncbi:Hsp70 family protein [Candidatus Raskinella chloraquaticus]|uniref:Molecular chaperone Hsp70 n=1 Tax=Candidatus Raskinella chloraquaticus TaxID=1951219 RepID=A0A1W9HTY6_9HYPH|nr:MAG: molecular chaperone Hsp70 [Proteobacteria bacterium SG_bin8]